VQQIQSLAKPVQTHPDMQFHHLGGQKIVCLPEKERSDCKKLLDMGFELIKYKNAVSQDYPHDIALDAARVGQFLLCVPEFTDRAILNYCQKNQIHILPVSQGYAKCSVCVVDSNSIITADISIAKRAIENGIKVLRIKPGYINLPGYDTGFIGGCCGKISRNKLFVCGDLKHHPDYYEFLAFLAERKITIEMLGGEQLTDIGGLIPLIEKA
jgi:hypothetical protein